MAGAAIAVKDGQNVVVPAHSAVLLAPVADLGQPDTPDQPDTPGQPTKPDEPGDTDKPASFSIVTRAGGGTGARSHCNRRWRGAVPLFRVPCICAPIMREEDALCDTDKPAVGEQPGGNAAGSQSSTGAAQQVAPATEASTPSALSAWATAWTGCR